MSIVNTFFHLPLNDEFVFFVIHVFFINSIAEYYNSLGALLSFGTVINPAICKKNMIVPHKLSRNVNKS